MALNKIKTGSITDDAVNSDKLAAGSVTSSELNKTAITGQTELSETANDADFTLIFDTSASALKKVLRSNLKQSAATISSISPTTVNDTTGTSTFTITGTGFTAGTTARLIGNGGQVQEFDTVTRSSTTSITATLANTTLNSNGAAFTPYDVQVTNGEGISTLLANQVSFNASPVFTTAAGSLGSGRFNMTGVEVNATDPESAGVVTFEKQSGALPPGISLTNTSANGGTATFTGSISPVQSSDTVFNFVLRAVDAASNTSSRSFSFTAQGPVSQSFTSSGTFSVPSGVSSVDVLVVAGGGGGGDGPNANHTGGGGGAGGLIFMPGYPVTPGGTVSVTVGCGGGAGPSGSGPFTTAPYTGQDSVFGTITAKGGGGGMAHNMNSGQTTSGFALGGSGGGRSAIGGSNNSTGGCATQPTQPDDSGAYGFGNAGGSSGYYGPGVRPGSGGGGGAGNAGGSGGYTPGNPAPGFGTTSGNGGIGKAYTIADGTTPVYYAGGGGGGGGKRHTTMACEPSASQTWTLGGNPTPSASGAGGLGGGGDGGLPPGCGGGNGQAGQANKGGGGGGGDGGSRPSAAGGKGVVIVRY